MQVQDILDLVRNLIWGVGDGAVLKVRWLKLMACCQRRLFVSEFRGKIAVLDIRSEPDH